MNVIDLNACETWAAQIVSQSETSDIYTELRFDLMDEKKSIFCILVRLYVNMWFVWVWSADAQ